MQHRVVQRVKGNAAGSGVRPKITQNNVLKGFGWCGCVATGTSKKMEYNIGCLEVYQTAQHYIVIYNPMRKDFKRKDVIISIPTGCMLAHV